MKTIAEVTAREFTTRLLDIQKNGDRDARNKAERELFSLMNFKNKLQDKHAKFIGDIKACVIRNTRNLYMVAHAFNRARLDSYVDLLVPDVPVFGSLGQLSLHASLAYRKNNLDDAEKLWTRMLEMDPEYLPAIDGLIKLYGTKADDRKVALMIQRRLEAVDGNNPDVRDLCSLIVYRPWRKLMRVGAKHDGGYLLMQQDGHYDCFLSGGVGGNVEFEEQFCSKFDVNCYAFDPTVNSLPSKSDKINFIKKGIGKPVEGMTTNLSEYLASHKDVFVKMDIEGFEYSWLESLEDDCVGNIKQLVMEWHRTYSKRRLACLARLSKTHALVHVHANNSNVRCKKIAGVNVPHLFETTFVRRDVPSHTIVPNTEPLPHPCDAPNKKDIPEFPLTWWPFVTR